MTTETKEKDVLLTIGNCRILRNDPLNVTVERLETSFNKKDQTEKNVWRFKGYSGTFLGALQMIWSKGLLTNETNLRGLENHLNEVRKSERLVLSAIKEIERDIRKTVEAINKEADHD